MVKWGRGLDRKVVQVEKKRKEREECPSSLLYAI